MPKKWVAKQSCWKCSKLAKCKNVLNQQQYHGKFCVDYDVYVDPDASMTLVQLCKVNNLNYTTVQRCVNRDINFALSKLKEWTGKTYTANLSHRRYWFKEVE